MRQRRPDGRLYAVAGASRSGKTVWTGRKVETCSRLLVWDFKGEWHLKYRCRKVGSLHKLGALVRPGAAPARLAFFQYPMNRETFDAFCRLAFVWMRGNVGSLVVEETASVTSPGKAPEGWGNILRMGLGFGCDIYALTQTPTESDKTAFRNASVFHCHRLARLSDQKMLASEMNVKLAQITALQPLQWIEKDDAGSVTTGVVEFNKSRNSRAV